MLSIKEFLEHPFVVIGTYVCIVIAIVISTKAYLGYLTVQQTIQANNQRKYELEQHIAFLRDYRLPYLDGEYSYYFMHHQNGVALPTEQIIKFVKSSETALSEQIIISPSGNKTTPTMVNSGRKWYFQFKLKQVK